MEYVFHHWPWINAYTKLIDAYTRNGSLKPGKLLHSHLIINGFLASSVQLSSKLIRFYIRCKHLSTARQLFDVIPHRNDVRTWVALVGSYSFCGYYEEALNAFNDMRNEGFRYDRIVLPSVLKACANLPDSRTGDKLHAAVLKCGFGCDAFVACALIDMYSKCGTKVEDAKRVFDEMVDKDLVSLNALVSGYVRNGAVKDALVLVEEMKLSGLEPDIVTWNTLVSGFSQANDGVMVRKIFGIMEDSKLRPDVVSWTSVVSGLVQNFQNVEAVKAFRRMLGAGVFPTSATISALLPAHANSGDLRRGKEIHGYSVVMGFEEDVYVRSSLIDMYAKCGSIGEAKSLFQNMSRRNMVTWNSMIFGFANHGYCWEAIELFDEMLKQEENKLDHLTFTAALTACSHAGMVELGESLFQMMQEKYQIRPRLEHYACFVDLLGRAGKLSEAYEFIQRMHVAPDLFVWGALLGACKKHGDVDLAERAAKELARLEPQSAGSSVVLLNIYNDFNRWENAIKVKKMMKKRKLKRLDGCSWIDLV